MLDINFVKNNREIVKNNLINRKVTSVDIDKLLSVYEEYLDVLRKVELHRNLRNKLSEDISKVSGDARQKLISEASQVKQESKDSEDKLSELKKAWETQLSYVPNISSPEMPIGKGEAENEILKVWLPQTGYLTDFPKYSFFEFDYMPKTNFEYKDHVELGELLDIIDIDQSAKVSGSRFSYIKNEAVLLQEAIFFLLKSKLLSMGYKPLMSPVLVRERALFGTSHFPEGRDQVYKIENSNVEEGNELYLIGSSEPANFAYFMDRTLDGVKLPIKVFAQTPCFRSEVGSWGKDVRGIKRVHQFDKVEMNCVCTPNQSRAVFDEYLSVNEWLLQELKLPYRIVNKCTGDCGYNASYYQYDWEVWRPGLREFMEGGTDTLTTDYQARRLNIKYKDGDALSYVHTVNDTGATTRLVIAILENYQQQDGSVVVPDVLRKYTGFDIIKPVK